ncbi:GNAT family N-acetyltransferase [Saccharibacillus alkalitolerans]|uniref:GNAT family N-acetyltransferase n=1 Tax=Saccharibacillus alkalitolerans TaxID=2705290 RepID=A0ABX0FAG2_9BACL|nr:GNAT family protein [Saccharibacillus alkalitolerans]NGZ76469.1 GNAT family N-acetyltransferase [Saccharibacillus alkalitolerans]
MNIDPQAALTGSAVSLIPLEESHRTELCEVLYDPRIWEYTWQNFTSVKELEQDFDLALAHRANQTQIPFVIVHRQSGAIVGTTRIGDIDTRNRGVEIGWTSVSPDHWRTVVNTECKYLLLRCCFEQLGVFRVQFSVSGRNLRSQKAVERIGAVKEGVFRKHRIEPGGPVHDNVFYSILDTEWPAVKENLEHLMQKYEEPAGI